MIKALKNAMTLPDLRRKLLYTLLILVVFRLVAHVPVPGVDRTALAQLLAGTGGASRLFNLMDMLSGGAMAQFSVMATGVYPYVTASIILQLLVPIIPSLERLAQEGQAGQEKMNRWTYYMTVPLALLQALGQIRLVNISSPAQVLPDFGFATTSQALSTVSILGSMTAGTMFAIWLGELISEQGIGNGLSMIIFAGIVSRVPENLVTTWVQSVGTGGLGMGLLTVGIFLVITAITVLFIVVVQEGQRRIPVQYGKRVRGLKMYGGQSTHIPLRINTAGMIPLIFAQSILTFPAVIAQFFIGAASPTVASIAESVMNFFSAQSAGYGVLYFLGVVGFTYFYTDVMVQQQDLPGNLQRQGGFIPGIRPGRRTAEYINAIYRRITLIGALFLGIVAVLPYIVDIFFQTRLLITSAGLLIVVGVVLDTMRQLEAQLLMRQYEGFIK